MAKYCGGGLAGSVESNDVMANYLDQIRSYVLSADVILIHVLTSLTPWRFNPIYEKDNP
jgi:hypothetical protein